MSFVDDFLDLTQNLPQNVTRMLSLIREIDKKSEELNEELSEKYKQLLQKQKKNKTEKANTSNNEELSKEFSDIESKFERAKSFALTKQKVIDEMHYIILTDNYEKLKKIIEKGEKEYKEQIITDAASPNHLSSFISEKNKPYLDDNSYSNNNYNNNLSRKRKNLDRLAYPGSNNKILSNNNRIKKENSIGRKKNRLGKSSKNKKNNTLSNINQSSSSRNADNTNSNFIDGGFINNFSTQTTDLIENNSGVNTNQYIGFGKNDYVNNGEKQGKEKEEIYCICKGTSYGDMIGCDNKDCPYGGWFHYACVGIEGKPTEESWYCPECRKKREKIEKNTKKKKKK